jgi:3-methylfumaryl-CoA hydratase
VVNQCEKRGDPTSVGLGSWIGRTETLTDVSAAAPLEGLAALLDYGEQPWAAGCVPPLGHWLFFLPRVRQSMIDVDGHPRRGGFLPPVPLPRRMWAAGRIVFRNAIPVGAPIERVSTITDVAAKTGTSGPLVFVTVHHEISVDGRVAIIEDQDLVYREIPPSAAAPPPVPSPAALRAAASCRTISIDAAALFRYSALTFNAHRIHYDRDYARDVEKYPGLVVHGPFVATLLMDWFLHHVRGTVTGFAFRARRPVYAAVPLQLCMGEAGCSTQLWALDGEGALCMSAEVEVS